MNRTILPALAATALACAPALTVASTAKLEQVEGYHWLEAGKLPYAVFEESVNHVDLENCPADLDPKFVFCRMTLADEQANIFVFELTGDQNLLAIRHYPLDSEFLPF